EPYAADVGTHLISLPDRSCGVEEPGLEAEAEVLVEANLEVALALRRIELVRDAHLALVARAGADRIDGGAAKLHVAGIAVAKRGVERAVGGVAADAVEPARRPRARRHEREADAAGLALLGPDGPLPAVSARELC